MAWIGLTQVVGAPAGTKLQWNSSYGEEGADRLAVKDALDVQVVRCS